MIVSSEIKYNSVHAQLGPLGDAVNTVGLGNESVGRRPEHKQRKTSHKRLPQVLRP